MFINAFKEYNRLIQERISSDGIVTARLTLLNPDSVQHLVGRPDGYNSNLCLFDLQPCRFDSLCVSVCVKLGVFMFSGNVLVSLSHGGAALQVEKSLPPSKGQEDTASSKQPDAPGISRQQCATAAAPMQPPEKETQRLFFLVVFK